MRRVGPLWHHGPAAFQPRGCSSMVEPQSSKLITRVRFPSSPPCVRTGESQGASGGSRPASALNRDVHRTIPDLSDPRGTLICMSEFTDEHRAMLDFESTWWSYPGSKAAGIRDRFAMSS